MTGTYLEAVTYLTEQNTMKPGAKWEIKEHKEKRTLTQNAYYWALIPKVAQKKRQSVPYTHNYELRAARYARWVDGQMVLVKIPDNDESEEMIMEQMNYHLAPTNQREGDKRVYVLLRGSSELNTTEFAHLLDCLIQDAHSVGVETLTPNELEQMRMYEQRLEDARKNKSQQDT